MNRPKNKVSSLAAVRTFLKVGTCSEALCHVLDQAYDSPMTTEEHAAQPLAGGILGQGYQCGQLWGAALAAGAQAYRLFGPGPQAEAAAIAAAQRLVEVFHNRNKEINCLELTDSLWKNPEGKRILWFFLKGGPLRCFGMAGSYAPAALREIETALAEKPVQELPGPVSCTALLAEKVGATDLQRTMAAGLAGGIGLSGGGCGALGAAVWLTGLRDGQAGAGIGMMNPKASALIEPFVESADYEFECAKIVGRKFENVAEHAAYVCAGGCSRIIETLAAHCGSSAL